MTPEDLGTNDGGTEAEQERVRRLLAATARPVQMPTDVADRLDDVLATLRAERAAQGGTSAERTAATAAGAGHVVDLTERRRRRWPKVLVAAAAVSVLGLGVGNLMDGGLGGATSEDSAAGGAVAPEAAVRRSPDADGGPTALSGQPPNAQGDAQSSEAMPEDRVRGDVQALRDLPQVRTESVTADAQRILAFGPAFPAREQSQFSTDDERKTCAVPSTSRGDLSVAVRLDGERATLVFRAAEDGRREVEVFTCDDATAPAVVTTVRAR